MAPLQPVRLRRATQAEIDAAWQRIHDNPDPVEPKRIRHKHPKKPKATSAQKAQSERLERLVEARRGARKRERARATNARSR